MSIYTGTETGMYDSLVDELSYDQIQQMLDQMLGDNSFSFSDMVQSLIHDGKADVLHNMTTMLREMVFSSLLQDRKMFVSLLAIALVGAVFSNFSKILQGREVAKTAFYIVYMLFFVTLSSSFLQVAQLAGRTLENLLTFIKVMIPSFFISLSFRQGGVAAGAYYEFALAMIMVVNWLLVGLAVPAIHLYFFLQVVNQLSEQDMFSKMAELIRDGWSGILTSVGDVEKLSRAMEKLLTERGLAAQMGQHAREIGRKASPEQICRQWETYAEEIMAGEVSHA